MFLIIKTLHNFLKLLNSETSPAQLSAGVAFGMLLGFVPIASLSWICFFLLVCLFRVNFSMFFLSFALFGILSFALDPVFDWFGYLLLVDVEVLRPLWIQLTTVAIFPFFHFNNTIMAGSIGLGLVLFIPVFMTAKKLVLLYRKQWREKLQKSKAIMAFKATPFYGIYDKYQNLKTKFNLV
jgi:uncharacterized protein (TIGR03546 family)